MPTTIVKRLELGAAARADLRVIWRYTKKRWSRAQADRYGATLNAAITSLAGDSALGHLADIPGYRRLNVQAHVVFYRETDVSIQVVRILHASMDHSRHLPA